MARAGCQVEAPRESIQAQSPARHFARLAIVVLCPTRMIYLLRHGQTEWNRDNRLQGQGNSELTELGCAQAEQLAELLAREIAEPERFRLISSPLKRARETAESIARKLALPIEYDARLAEVALGEWEGRLHDEVLRENASLLAGSTPYDWYFRAPGGETFEAMMSRVSGWMRESGKQNLIAVCHGMSGRFVRGLYANLDRETMLLLPVPQDGFYLLDGGRITFVSATKELPNPRGTSSR